MCLSGRKGEDHGGHLIASMSQVELNRPKSFKVEYEINGEREIFKFTNDGPNAFESMIPVKPKTPNVVPPTPSNPISVPTNPIIKPHNPITVPDDPTKGKLSYNPIDNGGTKFGPKNPITIQPVKPVEQF